MAETYSVKAVLSADVSQFNFAFKSAQSAVANFGSKVKGALSSVGTGILQGVGQQITSFASGSLGSLVDGLEESSAAWKTFNSNMKTFDTPDAEIASVSKELKKFAADSIYSASDMASTYSQLAAVGTKNTTELVKGFGGLAAASSNPVQAMKTLSQQATQAAAKPTLQWMDFKLMLEQTPAGMAVVAKEMNKNGKLAGDSVQDLITAVQDGTVKTQDFFDAISTVGSGSDEMSKKLMDSATTYKTVGQAMDGLVETATGALQPAFDAVSQIVIDRLTGINDVIANIDGDALATKITGAAKKIEPYLTKLWDTAKKVASGFKTAFSKIAQAVQTAFGNTGAMEGFTKILEGVQTAFGAVSDFLTAHAEAIGSAIKTMGDIISSVIGFITQNFANLVNGISPYVKILEETFGPVVSAFQEAFAAIGEAVTGETAKFGQSASSLETFRSVCEAVAGVLVKLAGFLRDNAEIIGQVVTKLPVLIAAFAGFKIVTSVIGMFTGFGAAATGAGAASSTAASSILQLAAAVGIIAVSFALITQSAVALTSAGFGAIAMFAAMAAGVAAFLIVGTQMITQLAALGPSATTAGAALLMLGGAVLMIAAGFAIMAAAAVALTNAGAPAIAMFAAMAAATVALVAIVGALGPQMSAATAPMLALGAAVLMIASGFALMAQAATQVASGGAATIAVFVGMAAGAVALVAAMAALGPLLTVGAAGFLALGAGIMMAGAGFALLGNGALAAAKALTLITAALPALVTYAGSATASIAAISAGLLVFTPAAAAAGATALVLTAGFLGTVAGAAALAVALAAVTLELTTIASKATSANESMQSMVTAVDVVDTGLNSIKTAAQSAMNAIISAFKNSAGNVKTSGGLIVASLKTVVAGAVSTETGFKTVATSLLAVTTVLKSASTATSAIAKDLKSIATQSTKGAASLLSLGSSAATAGRQMTTAFSGNINNGMNSAIGAVRSGCTVILQAIVTLGISVGTNLRQAFTPVAGIVQTAMTSAAKSVLSSATSIRTVLTSMSTAIISMLNRLSASAVQEGQLLATGYANAIRSGSAQAQAAARSLCMQAVQGLSAGVAQSRVWGQHLGENFASGIRAQSGSVRAAANQLAGAAAAPLHHSTPDEGPLKEDDKWGAELGHNFAAGINQTIPEVSTASENMASAIYNGIAKTTTKGSGKNKQIIAKTADEIESAYISAAEKRVKELKKANQLTEEEEGRLWKSVANRCRKGGLAYNQAMAKVADTSESIDKDIISNAEDALERYETYHGESLENEVKYWNEIRKACKEGTEARYEADKKYFDASKKLNEKILSAQQTFADKVKDVQDKLAENIQSNAEKIRDSYDIFDEVKLDDEDNPINSNTVVANAKAQIAAYDQYEQAMEKIASRQLPEGLMDSIMEKGVKDVRYLQALASMTDSQWDTMIQAYEKKSSVGEKVAELGANKLRKQAVTDIQALQKDYEDSLKELGVSLEDYGMDVGQKAITGISAGIVKNSPAVRIAIQKGMLDENIFATMSDQAVIELGKVMDTITELARETGVKIEDALTPKKGEIFTLQAVIDNLKAKKADLDKAAKETGTNVGQSVSAAYSASLTQGITTATTTAFANAQAPVSTAATTVMQTVGTSMQAAAPSTIIPAGQNILAKFIQIFSDAYDMVNQVGQNIAQSLADGINSRAGAVEGAVARLRAAINSLSSAQSSYAKVSTPRLQTATVGASNSGTTLGGHAANITVTVPVNLNGRQIAKASAKDMAVEMNRNSAHSNRQKGKV